MTFAAPNYVAIKSPMELHIGVGEGSIERVNLPHDDYFHQNPAPGESAVLDCWRPADA